MADGDINIKITASTDELKAQMEQAKAAVQGLASEGGQLRTSAAVMSEALQRVGNDARKVTEELLKTIAAEKESASAASTTGAAMNTAASAIGGVAPEAKKAEEAVKSFHGSTAVLTREMLVLGREAARGNFSRMAGSFTILATQGLGLSVAMLSVIGAVAAVTAGLGYLIIKAIEAKEAIDQIRMTAEFANNLFLDSTDTINQYADELANVSLKSKQEALDALHVIASIPNISKPAFMAAKASLTEWGTAHHETLTKAAEDIKKMLADEGPDVIKYANALGAVNPQLREMARQAELSGSSNQVMAARLALVDDALKRVSKSVDENKNSAVGADISFGNWIARMFALGAAAEGGAVAIDTVTQALKVNTVTMEQNDKERQRQIQLTREQVDENRNLIDGLNRQKGSTKIEKTDEAQSQIKQYAADVKTLQTQLDNLKMSNAPAEEIARVTHDLELFNERLANSRTELNNIQFGPVLDQAREKVAELAGTWTGSQTALLAAQVKVLEGFKGQVSQEVAGEANGQKQILEIDRMIAEKRAQMRRAAGGEALSQTKLQMAQIGDAEAINAIARLQKQMEFLQEELAGHSLNYKARLQVETEYYKLSAELKKLVAKQDIEIARETTSTEIELLRKGYEQKKAVLDEGVRLKQITVGEEYDELRKALEREYQLQLELLQKEAANDKLSVLEKLKVNDDILKAKADLNLRLAKLDDDRVRDEKKAADESARAWKQSFDGISSAFTSEIGSMLKGQEGFAQAARNIAAKLIEDEISLDAKWLIQHTLYKALGIATDKQAATGGILAHLFEESTKTTASATGTAARKAISASENDGIFGMILKAVGQFLFGETEKTAAAVAGATARAAATEPPNVAAVLSYAAEGAAAAGAAVAGIPIVGPALAPEAAAATYAVLAGYAPAASAEGGLGNVPYDNMMTFLHKNEMVLPASLAVPMRSMLQQSPAAMFGGGNQSSSSTTSNSSSTSTYNINIHAIDTQSGAAFIKNNAGSIVKALKMQTRNGAKFA